MAVDVSKSKKHEMIIPLSERLTLNIDEFCGLVGIGRSTYYKAVMAGDIVPCKYGKRTLITREEAKRFVKNMPGNRSQP